MITRQYRLLVLILLLSLVGCSGIPINLGNGSPPVDQTPPATSPPDIVVIPTASATGSTSPVTQAAGEQYIRIWLPPGFDPNTSGPANDLLKARLGSFESENPSVQVVVRVKDLDGPGGMLDALVAANAAAPSDLPDLVLLPRPILESAAVKGLLYPYDGLTSIMEDQNWFDYALQLAHLKDRTFGLPFAGDVMVLARSASMLESSPLSLKDAITQTQELLFPAADPQGLFTLCMYLAEGGTLQDGQGRPALEETPLASVLEYEQQANLAGVMPYTLTQFTDDAQVWESFLGGQYPMAVTWTSTFFRTSQEELANLAISPLPTPDGVPYTLATGWSWALAGQDNGRRTLAVKLAEYLVESEFMAEWSRLAGYLPPRVDSLQSWQTSIPDQVFEQVSYSASLVPSADLISNIGPALQEATLDVLAGKSDPHSAAQSAMLRLAKP